MLTAVSLACWRAERVVFAGLSFSLAPGQAALLLGPNGAGKSSLLRVLAGLLPAVEGEVLWAGEDIRRDPGLHGRRLRYLGHQEGLKASLTVAENLTFQAALAGGEPAAALNAMGLGGLADLPARLLSAGQRRRLALARLALAPASLWLLDEPTLGLDDSSVERFGAMLASHRKRGGIVVAATHLPLPMPEAVSLRLA